MPTKITEIPKTEALIILGDLMIRESEEFIKGLDLQISRLKSIKRDLLKLKCH